MLFTQAPPGAHVFPVDSVDAARRRFEHRPLVPGENRGRMVAAGPGRLILADPANNQFTLFEPAGSELPGCLSLPVS
ncbi:hypothetical protein E4631_20150 [Hymenobacter sp. UV11]|uniref:hypothetical protein n=1 Tax=Hymenobacter sp. UV11 TaxID=1849735 RepID=UPI00105FAD20|nr:hypothetical protein [Hymenobacter sp. UV11]TFZ64312.1 hypothetical protein E4631_20150 [Hymenobacter sp. UV11]